MHTLFILSGSSGSGKTTLMDKLISNQDLNISRGRTFTTREMRNQEDPLSYYFVSKDTFNELLRSAPDTFIETNIFSENMYGTPTSIISQLLFNDVLLLVDVNGKKKIEKLYGDKIKIVSIFIRPKTRDLRRNLIQRGESAEEIEKRMMYVERENEASKTYSFNLISDSLDDLYQGIIEIINFKRMHS